MQVFYNAQNPTQNGSDRWCYYSEMTESESKVTIVQDNQWPVYVLQEV